MQKKITIAIIMALCLTLGAVSAYAWMETKYVSRGNGITVEIAEPEEGDMFISSTQGGTYGTSCSNGLNKTLSPVTSDDGRTFYNKGAQMLTTDENVLKTSYWIKSESALSQFSVSDIIVTGAKNDEFAKSLRVSVTWNNETKIFAPVEGADKTIDYFGTSVKVDEIGELFSAGTSTNPQEAKVCVWFEGNDSSCTSSNAYEATGGLNITLRFAAI